MDDVMLSWLGIIKDFVWSFFNYKIADGVSFGSFIVAVLVFDVIISFVFTRIVK